MNGQSAGLLMCRKRHDDLEYFLVHPGGPFWAKKNDGAWSIPKGAPNEGEDLLIAAQREFLEETGLTPKGPFHAIGTAKLRSGKVIHAWAFEGEWDPSLGITSNTFSLEWPPKSKKYMEVPENDRAEWMTKEKARRMINPAQIILLERAAEIFRSS